MKRYTLRQVWSTWSCTTRLKETEGRCESHDRDGVIATDVWPLSSGDLFIRPGWESSSWFTSCTMPDTGAYCDYIIQMSRYWGNGIKLTYEFRSCFHTFDHTYLVCRHPHQLSIRRTVRMIVASEKKGYETMNGVNIPPWATSAPSLGNSTKTTSPKLDCA